MSTSSAKAPTHLELRSVTGYFAQDDADTDPQTFDYTKENFGLLERAYDTDAAFDPQGSKTQWQRFAEHVRRLNEEGGESAKYKVLFLGRHGQGYHNVAESFYGSKDWDCYWSLQDGNTTSTWADAHLTPTGIAQAETNKAFWQTQLTDAKTPAPQSYYTSPLTRCLQTCYHSFEGLILPPGSAPFAPLIKELFREAIGVHTCDRRSTKTEIAAQFPDARFEDGFAEADPLWDAELRETNAGMDARALKALSGVFESDAETWISITAHSGEIASVMRVLGHRTYALGTGQAMPVLVRAEVVQGEAPVVGGEQWFKPDTCTEPPK